MSEHEQPVVSAVAQAVPVAGGIRVPADLPARRFRGRSLGQRWEAHSIVRIVFVWAFLAALMGRAVAEPPPDADTQNRQWFESLFQPGDHHMPCCSIADCHLTASRTTQTGYEVAIEDSWIGVPADRVLERVSNPTGRAVVCYRNVRSLDTGRAEIMIFCFVRPPES